jgi:tetratricopeptide (TPR) repeat protein
MRGRLDSAEMLAREAVSSPRPQIALSGRRTLRALDLLHGRLVAAQRVGRDQRNPTEDLTVRPRTGDERAPLLRALDLATEDLWVRQDSARVVRRLAAALRSWPVERLSLDDRPYLRLARLYALAGDLSEAKRWLARYDAEVTDAGLRRQDGPARATALARVAAAERRWEDALRETEVASRDVDGGPVVTGVGANFARGFIHAAAGHTDAAIVSFERFLAEPYDYRLTEADDIYLPIALEKLGALYEAKGNTAKALERYERFAALWKDADPELQPRVAEVRRRIARLRGRSG